MGAHATDAGDKGTSRGIARRTKAAQRSRCACCAGAADTSPATTRGRHHHGKQARKGESKGGDGLSYAAKSKGKGKYGKTTVASITGTARDTVSPGTEEDKGSTARERAKGMANAQLAHLMKAAEPSMEQ